MSTPVGERPKTPAERELEDAQRERTMFLAELVANDAKVNALAKQREIILRDFASHFTRFRRGSLQLTATVGISDADVAAAANLEDNPTRATEEAIRRYADQVVSGLVSRSMRPTETAPAPTVPQ